MHDTPTTRRGLFTALFALALMPTVAEARGRGGSGARRSSGRSAGRRSTRASSSDRRGAAASGGYAPVASAAPAGDCGCNTGNVCTGPRGGRYCITAAGNKRYLKR